MKFIMVIMTLLLIGCVKKMEKSQSTIYKNENETHLTNLRMLTIEGENAEAYFNADETKLIFQSTHGMYKCDQIFTMNLDGTQKNLVSTGLGRTTCSYYLPDGKIIYASTHVNNKNCPDPPDYSQGYVWKVYSIFDLFVANADGSNPQILNSAEGYDAEATVSPIGDKIVFTSMRNGDLDIYSMNIDGSNLIQLTDQLGYDGGPFYSWDGKKIVYRSYHPQNESKIKRYKDLLGQEMIEPSNFQIWVMDADGSNKKQITKNKYANFAPFFHPDGTRIIFCSNLNSENKKSPDFNLWMINLDGTGLEQITFFEGFDGFPVFTHDGKKIVFASNRNNKKPRDTNIFLADWVE